MHVLIAYFLLYFVLGVTGNPDLRVSVKIEDYEQSSLTKIIQNINAEFLGISDRLNILNNTARVLEEFNPHRFIHLNYLGVDPAAMLRNMTSEVKSLSNFAFHRKVTQIFTKMDDYHTVYIPPEPLRSAIATLGFSITRYYKSENATPTYLVTDSNYTITKIDGVPVHQLAIMLGRQGYGSNPASRAKNGMVSLTIRSLAFDTIPKAANATIEFTDGTKNFVANIPWTYLVLPSYSMKKIASKPLSPQDRISNYTLSKVPDDPRKKLYNIYSSSQFKISGVELQNDSPVSPISVPSLARNFYEAFEIQSSSGTYGYINIKTFIPEVPSEYLGGSLDYADYVIDQLAKTLSNMSYRGVVVDISDNGGGYIYLGKITFELLTDKNVPPIPVVSRATNLTVSMYSQTSYSYFRIYRSAVEQSFSLKEQFTGPVAYLFNVSNLYDGLESIRRYPQVFTGKLILVTDAESYSTSDFLASWVRDTEAGTVIGLDDSTGGGGASVIEFSSYQNFFSETFPSELPYDVDFTTANIRIFRNGKRNGGTLLENFGVRPDKRYYTTYRDVTNNNVEFLEYLGAELFL